MSRKKRQRTCLHAQPHAESFPVSTTELNRKQGCVKIAKRRAPVRRWDRHPRCPLEDDARAVVTQTLSRQEHLVTWSMDRKMRWSACAISWWWAPVRSRHANDRNRAATRASRMFTPLTTDLCVHFNNNNNNISSHTTSHLRSSTTEVQRQPTTHYQRQTARWKLPKNQKPVPELPTRERTAHRMHPAFDWTIHHACSRLCSPLPDPPNLFCVPKLSYSLRRREAQLPWSARLLTACFEASQKRIRIQRRFRRNATLSTRKHTPIRSRTRSRMFLVGEEVDKRTTKQHNKPKKPYHSLFQKRFHLLRLL